MECAGRRHVAATAVQTAMKISRRKTPQKPSTAEVAPTAFVLTAWRSASNCGFMSAPSLCAWASASSLGFTSAPCAGACPAARAAGAAASAAPGSPDPGAEYWAAGAATAAGANPGAAECCAFKTPAPVVTAAVAAPLCTSPALATEAPEALAGTAPTCAWASSSSAAAGRPCPGSCGSWCCETWSRARRGWTQLPRLPLQATTSEPPASSASAVSSQHSVASSPDRQLACDSAAPSCSHESAAKAAGTHRSCNKCSRRRRYLAMRHKQPLSSQCAPSPLTPSPPS
mmetsp:Transcript_95432/g.253587  ORF Transcript_95432/g.253587 Transcript_95432/m.253587 type:complete len:286 (+) Transcript_95432:1082-1939(+)